MALHGGLNGQEQGLPGESGAAAGLLGEPSAPGRGALQTVGVQQCPDGGQRAVKGAGTQLQGGESPFGTRGHLVGGHPVERRRQRFGGDRQRRGVADSVPGAGRRGGRRAELARVQASDERAHAVEGGGVGVGRQWAAQQGECSAALAHPAQLLGEEQP